MYNHAPVDYKCPVCLGVCGLESEHTLLKRADLVFKVDLVSVFINSFWIETVEGHVIVVPNDHFENLYDLPPAIGNRVFEVAQKLAMAMKASYKCDGITIRQNNEPAGNQHAFHYHLHIFPRYDKDSFNENSTRKGRLSKPEERLKYADQLRMALVQ